MTSRFLLIIPFLFIFTLFSFSPDAFGKDDESTDIKTLEVSPDIKVNDKAVIKTNEKDDSKEDKKTESSAPNDDSSKSIDIKDEKKETETPSAEIKSDTEVKSETDKNIDEHKDASPAEDKIKSKSAEEIAVSEKQDKVEKPKITSKDYVLRGKYPLSVMPWLSEIGLNNPEFSGLLYNFWYKSEASNLARHINKFEPSSSSPIVRFMMIEALTSETKAPLFNSKSPIREDINFMMARLNALIRLGAFDEAAQLYQKMIEIRPAKTPIPEELADLGVDAMALTGATDAACLETNLIAQALPTHRWLENKALCLLHWGQTEQANTLYNFLAESTENFKDRKEFETVYKAVLNNTYSGATISSQIQPLWNSILLSKGAVINEDRVYKTKNSVFLGQLARHPAISETTRALATSLCAAKGLMSYDKIRTIYMNTNYDDALIDSVIASDGANTKRQDVLYNAARNSYSPFKKLALLNRGVSLIKDKTSIPALLWADLERELSYNAAKLTNHVPIARSRLLAQSMIGYSDAWIKNINLDKKPEDFYKDEINVVLENYFSDTHLTDEEMTDWVNVMLKTHPQTGKNRIIESLIALEFTKKPVSDKIWRLVGEKPIVKKSDMENKIFGLEKQQSYGKYFKGDVYLAGLAQFSHSGFDGISPQELFSIMRLFHEYGLSDKNMKIGLEILSQSVL